MLHEIYTYILNKSGKAMKAAIEQLSWSSMLTDFSYKRAVSEGWQDYLWTVFDFLKTIKPGFLKRILTHKMIFIS